jgi:hypothetical protein
MCGDERKKWKVIVVVVVKGRELCEDAMVDGMMTKKAREGDQLYTLQSSVL